MRLIITKDVLLQNKTPHSRLDSGNYFARAKSRLEAIMMLAQKHGAKQLVIYGDFIQRISVTQAFELFGLIQRHPVQITWMPVGAVPAHVKASGLCLIAEKQCPVDIERGQIRYNLESITMDAYDTGYCVPLSCVPSAISLTADEVPGVLLANISRRGRAKYARTELSFIELQDDREFVRDTESLVEAGATRSGDATEFASKMQRYLEERKTTARSLSIEDAIASRANDIGVDSEVGSYLIELEREVRQGIMSA